MKANGSRTPALAFIFVTLLIDVLGFGLVIPVFPDLLKELSPVRGSAAAQAAHSATILGYMSTIFGLMQFLCAPILGGLSDRYGRRPVLLVSLACAALDYVLCAIAPNVMLLFVGRLIAGVTAASFTCASAYIADVSPPEKRAQNFGMIGAAFGVGFILGPALGGVVGGLSPRAPFWVAAILCGVNFLFGMFVLPESLAKENRRPFDLRRANPFGTFKVLFKVRWVLLLVAALVFLYLAQQALQTTWTISGQYRFGWKPSDMGWSLALIGAMSILVQMVILRQMLPRFGEAKTLLIGLVFQVVGFLGFGLATQSWVMFAMTAVWCLSFVGGPATQGLISKRFGDDEQGLVQGGLTSLQSVTGIVGPLISTGVFAYFTEPGHPHVPGAPFLLGAAMGVVTGVLAFWAMSLRRSDPAPVPAAA
jgi:DHA1 family tetracycline resistance protein-like MFS transporter